MILWQTLEWFSDKSKMGSILSYRNTNLNEYPYKMSPRIDSLLKNERGVKLDDSDIEKLFLISYSKLLFK